MTTQLPLELTVDKSARKVYINREFDAERSLVWDAFTKPEILDQWWAPKPYQSKTKIMDFKVGGRRFYAMVSPEGNERWSVQKYLSISPQTNFKFYNTFADANENPELPGSEWDLSFSEHATNGQQPKTKVSIVIYNESLERMEKLLALGFQEGMAMTLSSLQSLLETISQGRK